jgi:23S rRNA maturation-related 3'-5' exoribonuclease YhaM
METGLALDQDLILAGALLHDIGKAYSFNRPLDHALTGAKILKKLGYPRVASVVRQHVVISGSRPAGRVSEPEVVNYADKRVLEDKITPLAQRLDYIVKRYGRNEAAISRIKKYQVQIYQLEKDIFAVLPGGPAQLMSVDIEKECHSYGDKQA